jgi:hypothetical protein
MFYIGIEGAGGIDIMSKTSRKVLQLICYFYWTFIKFYEIGSGVTNQARR